jgi:hypothetical protein
MGLTPRERLFLDVMDVRSQFGPKYRRRLLEMLRYARTLPEFQKGLGILPRKPN